MNPETQTLDPEAVNLAKAIRQVETGNRQVAGASGEMPSRYQFTAGTWKKYAGEILGDENAPATLENENKVAYTKIKQWKDQGYNPGQIASMWNAGEGRPNAYAENWKGVNKYGVKYDTPAYAEKVATEYHKFKNENQQQTFNPTPFSNPTQAANPGAVDYSGLAQKISTTPVSGEQGLGGQLIGRTKDLSSAVQKGISGEINPLSSVLQVGGAIGGAVGDITNAALELIPGYKTIEKAIGRGAERFFNTDFGKSVAQSLNDFTNQHPELAADLGAGFNIVTAIPILKGLGAVKNVVLDSTSKVLANRMENSLAKGMTEAALKSSSVKAPQVLAKTKNLFKEMVSDRSVEVGGNSIRLERIIPDIEDGKFFTGKTSGSYQTTWQNINNLESKIDDILGGGYEAGANGIGYSKIADPDAIFGTTVSKLPNSGLTAGDIFSNAIKLDSLNKSLWEKLARGESTLLEANKLRSSLGMAIKTSAFETSETSIQKQIGKELYYSMSDYIKGIAKETKPLFEEITNQFRFQDGLKLVNGKVIKSGFIGGAIKGGAAAAGEYLGSQIGLPVVPAYLSYKAAGIAERKFGRGMTKNILNRSINPKSSVKQAMPKFGGLLGSALSQKEASIKNNPTNIK